jgi:hypothetical protein
MKKSTHNNNTPFELLKKMSAQAEAQLADEVPFRRSGLCPGADEVPFRRSAFYATVTTF